MMMLPLIKLEVDVLACFGAEHLFEYLEAPRPPNLVRQIPTSLTEWCPDQPLVGAKLGEDMGEYRTGGGLVAQETRQLAVLVCIP
jgi:hypothetical protein